MIRRRSPTRHWRPSVVPAAVPCSTASPWRLRATTPPGRRQLVVLFSDGQDSSSISDADTLVDVARRSTPTVAVVLLGGVAPAAGGAAAQLDEAGLGELSAISPIRLPARPAASWPRSVPEDDVTSTFRRVLEQFRTSYVLYFTPKGVERQGSHTLDVRVKNAKVEVRARRGYIWR